MNATTEILKGNNPMKVEQIFGPDIKPYEVLEFESMLRYEDFQVFSEYGFEKMGRLSLQGHRRGLMLWVGLQHTVVLMSLD